MNTFVASSLLFSSHGRNSLVAPPICRNWDFVFITHLLVVVVVVGKMVFTVHTSILFQSEMEKERKKEKRNDCVCATETCSPSLFCRRFIKRRRSKEEATGYPLAVLYQLPVAIRDKVSRFFSFPIASRCVKLGSEFMTSGVWSQPCRPAISFTPNPPRT